MKKNYLYLLLILFLFISTAHAINLPEGIIYNFNNFSVNLNNDFTVDNIIINPNELIFENNTENFSTSIISDNSRINISLYNLDLRYSLEKINFSAINNSANTQANITLGIFPTGNDVHLYNNDVENITISPLTVNSSGYINFTWNFLDFENFEFLENPEIFFITPTPNDNNYQNEDYAYVNVTATDSSNTTAFIDWNRSLVGWWRFNEETGENDTFFRDWSSYGNNGTCTNDPHYTTGKFGQALRFDGVDDNVSVADSVSLNITDAITIEAWIKGTGSDFIDTQLTTTIYNEYNPQFQVVDDKIYYVWIRKDESSDNQIWTAELNSTGFYATKRTTSVYFKNYPQLQVVGDKIYYVWEGDVNSIRQIWTAELNSTGFSAMNRTLSAYEIYDPQFQVVDGKIYYVWSESDGAKNQIWTAELNSTGFYATKRTTSAYSKYYPQLQVVNGKIYYVWQESDGAKNQIWTAELNSTGFYATKRTTSAYSKYYPQLQVEVNKTYYVWTESDEIFNRQVWTAELNSTGFYATKRTTSAFTKSNPQLQVMEDKKYYVWSESSIIWTAELNTTGFTAINKNINANYPQFQVVENKIYYNWIISGSKIGTAEQKLNTTNQDSNIINKGDLYGIGISDSDIISFLNSTATEGVTTTAKYDEYWNHVLMSYNKSIISLYINSILKDTATFTESINTTSLDLIMGDDFNGTIDEVKIWNRALTAAEINASYNAGLYRLETNFTNLADGTYTYTAYAQDLAGNTNQTGIRTLTIDTIEPTSDHPND
ncbi:hypothetical protein GQ473_05990, partial [archaeon]|nr:hypothetical protein [archaeon]